MKSEIQKSCAVCEHGKPSPDGKSILCRKCGLMQPGGICFKFRYDPLKRIPRKAPKPPAYSSDEFEL